MNHFLLKFTIEKDLVDQINKMKIASNRHRDREP